MKSLDDNDGHKVMTKTHMALWTRWAKKKLIFSMKNC
jgi:hypothetical protein